jgi:hypothetical protein
LIKFEVEKLRRRVGQLMSEKPPPSNFSSLKYADDVEEALKLLKGRTHRLEPADIPRLRLRRNDEIRH